MHIAHSTQISANDDSNSNDDGLDIVSSLVIKFYYTKLMRRRILLVYFV